MSEHLIGLPVDKAVELLKGQNVIITDFSQPDKYHTDITASKRVVKVVQTNDSVQLFVAGFKDSI